MGEPVDVFISYAAADEALCMELEKHLAGLKRYRMLRTWSDRSVTAGDDWRKATDARLAAAEVVLLLVSSDYLASDYLHEVEAMTSLARAHAGDARVIPVLVRACDLNGVAFEGLTPLPRDGVPVTLWPNRDAAWTAVAVGIREVITSAPVVAPVALCEGPGGVPATAVPHFLGRDDEMRELRGALEIDSAVCVVATGLGGIGKTSLVRQFVAMEAAAMFPDGSVWIDAMNLDADAARVCERFGYDGGRRPTVTEAAQFLARVLNRKRVLVVIDNVSDKFDVAALPIVGGKSRTVLTSRLLALHESLGQPAQQLVLGQWAEETCRAYLREVVPALASAPDKDLDALATYVGRLPLAVRLLARLLLRPGMTPARLLARLKQEPLGTLDKVATGADRSVAATFAASYEDLEDTHRRVLVALAACARLTTENVVARVVGLADDVAGDVLADLAECSLIDPVEASRWTMHDVVRLFVRAQPGIRQADEAHLAFAKEHVAAHQDPRDWQAMEAAMAEVLAAVDRLLDAA